MVYPGSQVQWVVPCTTVQRDGRTKGPMVAAGRMDAAAVAAEVFVMVTKTEWERPGRRIVGDFILCCNIFYYFKVAFFSVISVIALVHCADNVHEKIQLHGMKSLKTVYFFLDMLLLLDYFKEIILKCFYFLFDVFFFCKKRANISSDIFHILFHKYWWPRKYFFYVTFLYRSYLIHHRYSVI